MPIGEAIHSSRDTVRHRARARHGVIRMLRNVCRFLHKSR